MRAAPVTGILLICLLIKNIGGGDDRKYSLVQLVKHEDEYLAGPVISPCSSSSLITSKGGP